MSIDVVKDFGAAGDGVTPDSDAIQNAINEAETANGDFDIILGKAHLIDKELTVSRGVALVGAGLRGTRLVPAPTLNSWMLSVKTSGRSGEWQAVDETYDSRADHSGMELRNIGFDGSDRSVTHYGVRILRADDLFVDNVSFGFFSGTALQLGAEFDTSAGDIIRESDLRRLRIFKSGSPGVPAMILQQASDASGDGTNQVYFHQFRFVYNHGNCIIRNHNTTETLRRIMFAESQIHGLSHGSDIGNQQDEDIIVVEGNCSSVGFLGAMTNGAGLGASVFKLRPSSVSGKSPGGFFAKDIFVSNNPGALLSVDGASDFDLETRVNIGNTGTICEVASDAGIAGYEIKINATASPEGKIVIPAAYVDKGAVTWNGRDFSLAGGEPPPPPEPQPRIYTTTLLCNLPSGTLADGNVLNENSGFADSRIFPGVFWCNEDSGSKNVYAITYGGEARKVVTLQGAGIQGGQWEDMAYDVTSNSIWVANCGNNGHSTSTFRAYKFAEPDALNNKDLLLDVQCETYQFRWTDAPVGGWDCETMLVSPTGRLYFVTKEEAADTWLYAAPETLVKWTAGGNETNDLTKVVNWDSQPKLTCGDWASDNSGIYVAANSNSRGFRYSPVDFSLLEEFELPPPKKLNGSSQRESLCVGRTNDFLLTGTEGASSEVLKTVISY